MTPMTHQVSRLGRRLLSVWILCVLTVVTVGLLATIGSFANAFGILTDCTDSYDCSTSGCGPCSEANTWLTGAWIVQGVLLLISIAIVILLRRGGNVRTMAIAAAITLGLSVGTFVVSGNRASSSYCQSGQTPADMTGADSNYC